MTRFPIGLSMPQYHNHLERSILGISAGTLFGILFYYLVKEIADKFLIFTYCLICIYVIN